MSPSNTPLGRTASRGGGLSSISSVARFFGGDEHGLLSSEGHFWPQTSSIFGVEMASGQPPGKLVSSSSDMMTAGVLWGKCRDGCIEINSPLLQWFVSFCHHGPTNVRGAWYIWPSRSSAVIPQALFHLGRCRPLGTSGLPARRTLLTSPASIGDVRVGAMSSTLRI